MQTRSGPQQKQQDAERNAQAGTQSNLGVPDLGMLQRAVNEPKAFAGNPDPNTLLALQKTAGNQAVVQMIEPMRATPSPKPQTVQRKLTVGPAEDGFEEEADQFAERVARRAAVSSPAPRPIRSTLQRAPIGPEGGQVDEATERRIRTAQNGGSSLPDKIRKKLEPDLNADLSPVKVHTGRQAQQLSRDLGAKAFTHGNHIFYGDNQSPRDLQLTAHETVHTIQQGAVKQRGAQRAATAVRSQDAASVQLKRDSAQDKKDLNEVRQKVFWKLDDQAWPEALHAYQSFNITYQASGWWGRTKLGKWSRGQSALNPLRVRAKQLIPKRDTLAPDQVTGEIKDIANKAVQNTRASDISNSNLHHVTAMLHKIAYYLVESIPSSIRAMASKLANVTTDLDATLGAKIGDEDDSNRAKSNKVQNDEQDIHTALSSGIMDTRGFHGSASWLLEGLGKSGGKLLSQKSAFNAGLLKTGEGTTFSSGASLKTNVYIGKGETGFGTGASYAMAPAKLSSYNVSLLSDAELADAMSAYQRILQLETIVSEMDNTVVGSGKVLLINQILEKAKAFGIDPQVDPGYAHISRLQTAVQAREMLGKLQQEAETRKTWPDDDPRRQGGSINPDNYPILLEFDTTGLTMTEDFQAKSREAKGDYRLAGEATVADEIDLTNGRLKVVYVPEQFISKTAQKLKDVFGTQHAIQVRALEAIQGGITSGSKADKTIKATYGQLEKQQKSLDVKVKAQTQLADQMLDYVDKNEKSALHSSITKMMTEGIPPVDPSETPEALLMMGGPGSGKSTIIDAILDRSKRKNLVVADPDAVKTMLPTYQSGVKAGNKDIASKVHPESKKVTSSLVDQTIASRRGLLYDATGANKDEYQKLITKLKQAGYRVHLVLTHISEEEGVSRVKTRAVKTGRSVPESIVRSVYQRAPKNFVDLARQVHKASIFNNMGRTPKLVWSTLDGMQLSESDVDEMQEAMEFDEV